MQTYSLEDIWEKEIYLLIPFYIFTQEANFPKYNDDEALLQGLVDEFKEICVKHRLNLSEKHHKNIYYMAIQ